VFSPSASFILTLIQATNGFSLPSFSFLSLAATAAAIAFVSFLASSLANLLAAFSGSYFASFKLIFAADVLAADTF
jgi:hypothetical protein